jgi:tyrosine-protein phosphatase SIW14
MIPVSPGIWRGPQPSDFSEFQALAERGIRTVLDLENEPGEALVEEGFCDEAGIEFVSLPLSAWRRPRPEMIRQVIAYLNNPVHRPVFVHCRFGEDRTGLVIALYRTQIEGWPKRKAWREMLDHGFHRVCLGLTAYFWTH